MKKQKLDFICLVEIKTDISQIHRFCSRLRHRWEWAAIPSNDISGGIMVIWNRSVGNVTPVAISHSALHLVISSNDETWILTTVHNSQVIFEHKRLWHSLSKFLC